MHEISLVKALLCQIEDLVVQHRAKRVSCVKLTVGEFSGVEPDLLEMAFVQQSQNSTIAGASLSMTRRPLTGVCRSCSEEFPIVQFRFQCPGCGSADVQVSSGEELILESVTMET